jgi:bidirectional [NiFe] hydrogenase diaphorase subunit
VRRCPDACGTIVISVEASSIVADRRGTAARILKNASGDKRFRILEAHIKKFQGRQDALIEVLHKAQELFGYLEDDLLLFVAYKLKLPPSRVYGVATFYHFFILKPQGAHTCVVCIGTACYFRGADKVLASIEEQAKIKAGETTPDKEFSLLTARCLGACGIAPTVVYDGVVTPYQTPELATTQVNEWLPHGH